MSVSSNASDVLNRPNVFTIQFIGPRGGSGKSTASNLTANGAAKLGIPCAVLHTDVTREAQKDNDKRDYAVIDSTVLTEDGDIDKEASKHNAVNLFNLMITDPENDGGIVIIDGAGADSDLYTKLSGHVDLTIVCAVADPESPRAVAKIWPKLADPKVIVLGRWSGMKNVQNDVEVYVEQLPVAPVMRIKEMSAVKHITADFVRNDPRVNKLSIAVFLKIAQILEKETPKGRKPLLSKSELTALVREHLTA